MSSSLLVIIAVLVAISTAQSCNRINGDSDTFCGPYYDAVDSYFSVGDVWHNNPRMASRFDNATAEDPSISIPCRTAISNYMCAQFFPVCAPDDGSGQTPAARLVFICKSSCEDLHTSCPAVFNTTMFTGYDCVSDASGVEQDPEKPCLDLDTLLINNDGDTGATGTVVRQFSGMALAVIGFGAVHALYYA